ncbi:MAG: metallophosphatase family protein [Candidatus Eremiobacteraeota bacterium]|nr:metallophosphatase family protein [Candidatus Eremiobacteraeota bacterium]
MRYAVLSDIHANLESLNAFFALLQPDDAILCLGDIVGYGPNPNECVKLIRERAAATVLGNHDVAAIDSFGIEYFNPAAKAAMTWTQSIIDKEHIDWLNSLSYEIRVPEYLLVHGAPVNYFEYILDKRTAAAAFAATDAPLIFVGHTHIADYYALAPDGSLSHKHMQDGGRVPLEPGSRYLVNVGSVGQPRDLNPKASFVFYDPDERIAEYVRYDYPIGKVQQKIHEAHLPDALALRLEVGR